MTKVLGIIGIGLVAGSVIYVLLNKKEKTRKNINTQQEEVAEDFSSNNTVSIINRNHTHCENAEFEDIKASAVGNIYTRHEEATNIIKENVDIILSRTKISEDDNHDLDQISDELDELLREE
ncbi:hypothetical protein H9X78_02325 [Clostridium saudiense]|nr:hypothetical protein [Clostridium saudiense]MDU2291725.1 hypothetical protein [Clostridium celatum]